MTRKASNLDAIEPEATASLSPNDIFIKKIVPGDLIKITTRRGSIKIRVRQDHAIPEGVIFLPFCFHATAASSFFRSVLFSREDPGGRGKILMQGV